MGQGLIKWRFGGEEVLIGLKLGDSVAVNGVCLTVVEIKRQTFIVDVMPETLKRQVSKKSSTMAA